MRACNHQQQTIIFLAIPTDIIRMFLPRILYKAKTRLYIHSSDIREITGFTPLRFLHRPSPVAQKKRFSETWIDSLSNQSQTLKALLITPFHICMKVILISPCKFKIFLLTYHFSLYYMGFTLFILVFGKYSL